MKYLLLSDYILNVYKNLTMADYMNNNHLTNLP